MTVEAPVEMVQAVADLRLPPKADRRLQNLMDRNTEGDLSVPEREELEALVELSENLSLIRAQALHLLGKPQKLTSGVSTKPEERRMATATDTPVQVTSEAEARLSQLGMHQEVQQMIDHARLTIPELVALEVETWDDEFEPGEPHLCLVAWRNGPGRVDLETWNQWVHWFVRTFPPPVARWFSLDLAYRG